MMRLQLETIASHTDRSFSMMLNPRLSDLFFWHFHPEYELVYIRATRGTRKVGEHISAFQGSDLVLIGSNIPHLNFDYGLRGEYEKVVIHFKKEFVEQHISTIPELRAIHKIFRESAKGIAFHGELKEVIGKKLFQLENDKAFNQYLQLIDILQMITEFKEIEFLHEKVYLNKFSDKEQERLRRIYAFVDKNYHRRIELQEIANLCFMTKEAFCRYFKKMTKYTFIEFLNRYRISQSKPYLMAGESVSTACYNSGFESLSYFNRVFKSITNENPIEFKKKYSH